MHWVGWASQNEALACWTTWGPAAKAAGARTRAFSACPRSAFRGCRVPYQNAGPMPRASGQVGRLRVIAKRCFLKHPWAGIDMT